MNYLVDANVLSEPTRPSPHPGVVAWLKAHEPKLAADAIIVGELSMGIEALPAGRRRHQLEAWFGALTKTLVCLPWDAAVGRRWARLMVELKSKGRPLPVLDSMIAATALHHGLTVATRNVDDFSRTGVRVVDPFTSTSR